MASTYASEFGCSGYLETSVFQGLFEGNTEQAGSPVRQPAGAASLPGVAARPAASASAASITRSSARDVMNITEGRPL